MLFSTHLPVWGKEAILSNSIGELLHNRPTTTVKTTGLDLSKTTANNCKGYQCTVEQVDVLVADAMAAGVCNPRMKAWYCKAAYVLGSERFMRAVSQAREGRNPAKLFSYLINLELKKPQAGQVKVTNTRPA
jgi:hypothetical protein